MALGLAGLGAPVMAAPYAAQDRPVALPVPPHRAEPARPPGEWVTNADYPDAARRNLEEGVVGFRLIVGLDGTPTNCEITAPSGSDRLDAATCELMLVRARFKPARDKRGRAVTDRWSSRFRWVLERPDLPRAGQMELRFSVGADGALISCTEDAGFDGYSFMGCGDIRDMRAIVRDVLRGTAEKPATVSVIVSFVVDGLPDSTKIKIPDGLTAASINREEFDVDESGRVSGCITVVDGETYTGDDACQYESGFVGDGKRHHIVSQTAYSSDTAIENLKTFLMVGDW